MIRSIAAKNKNGKENSKRGGLIGGVVGPARNEDGRAKSSVERKKFSWAAAGQSAAGTGSPPAPRYTMLWRPGRGAPGALGRTGMMELDGVGFHVLCLGVLQALAGRYGASAAD